MTLQRMTICALLFAGWSLGAQAGEVEEPVLPASILFATSTGYWEDDGGAPAVQRAPAGPVSGAPVSHGTTAPGDISDGTAPVVQPNAKGTPRHGYYKLFAVRQPDRTAKVYLQQIAQAEDGPAIVSTVELQELNELKPYVTDIRPESSGGMIKEPGLFAMVHLKTEPDADPESWTVIIDEFGEVSVGKASN